MISPMPSAASRARSSARSGWASAVSAPSSSATPVRIAPCRPAASRCHRAGLRVGLPGRCGRWAAACGSGERSNSTVARSTPAIPSISEWWVLVISAKRLSSRPSISHISHSGFERSSCWEKMRAVRSCSCSMPAGRRQRAVADVVLEVEVGVVDPHRAAAVDGRVGELVAVAGNQVQAPADLLEELVHRRRGPLDDREAADVHVRDGALLVQEGGVDWGQPIEVALRHRLRVAGPRLQ